MEKKYVVRKSKIHGTGAFALKYIKKGERIAEYLGRKISKEESEKIYEKLQEKLKNNHEQGEVYIFDLNDEWDLDGDVPNNPAKFINHSCNPNAETEQDEDDRIWISATKDIKEGEEITFNYGYNLENYKDNPCKCGSENCIGYILDEKYWKKVKK